MSVAAYFRLEEKVGLTMFKLYQIIMYHKTSHSIPAFTNLKGSLYFQHYLTLPLSLS